MNPMQIDSPTVQRLGKMLLERAGLAGEFGRESDRLALDESSPEVRALIGRVTPICEVLYLVMIADDDADASELNSIRGAIETLTAGGLSQRVAQSMLDRYEKSAAEQGRPERLAQVAAQLSGDRDDAEAALALAAAIAVADGSVAAAEENVLVNLSELLGISSKRSAVILDTSR